LRQGLIWRIGNGVSNRFWANQWSGCGSLDSKALDPSMVDNELLVQDFWIHNEWDTTMLYACLLPDMVEMILSIPISSSSQRDKLIWKLTLNGTFSVKSAYFSSMDLPPVASSHWKQIWKLQIPPKLKLFSWLFYQSRLLTNVNRVKRCLSSDPSCQCCPGIPETMIHLFSDFPKAVSIWRAIGGPSTMLRTLKPCLGRLDFCKHPSTKL
jgi:hypothetical protein